MKTNKFWSIIMMLVFALGATFAVSSCSNDDDIDDVDELAGTSWKVDFCSESEDARDFVGVTMTFKADGKIKFSERLWSYATWSVEDGMLRIVVGDDEPDDCLLGFFTISGKKATYRYDWWGDYSHEWYPEDGDLECTMTLSKQ